MEPRDTDTRALVVRCLETSHSLASTVKEDKGFQFLKRKVSILATVIQNSPNPRYILSSCINLQDTAAASVTVLYSWTSYSPASDRRRSGVRFPLAGWGFFRVESC